MPKVVGRSTNVVDHEGLTIDELAGNVATSNDRISIAHVKVANPSSEPWLSGSNGLEPSIFHMHQAPLHQAPLQRL